MTTQIGLGIGAREVRAVLVRDGKIVWHASRAIAPASLSDAVLALLRAAPSTRLRRTPVLAAIGPSAAQVKRLSGVPTTTRRSHVTQLVRVNANRFFLRNGIPLAVAPAHCGADGWWGSAMDLPCVAAIEDACERAGVPLRGFVPTITAIAALTQNAQLEWRDESVRATIAVRGGSWVAAGRDRQPPSDAPALLAAITRLGPNGVAYADAFAAASSSQRSPLFLRASMRRRGRDRSMVVRAALGVMTGIAFVAALLAPGTAAARQERRDAVRLHELRGVLIRWYPAEKTLRERTAALKEVESFVGSGRSALQFLAELSRALPDSTAVISARIDSSGASVTMFAARAASIIPVVSTLTAAAEPQIVGAVTRETLAGIPMQRLALRFGWKTARNRAAEASP